MRLTYSDSWRQKPINSTTNPKQSRNCTSLKVRLRGSFYQSFPEQALVFTCPGFYKSFENAVGKEEIARNEQFLLFPPCFLTVWITFSHVYQISNCRLQTLSVWKSLKFVVWERVKKNGFLFILIHL